jgi:hypothetical protein
VRIPDSPQISFQDSDPFSLTCRADPVGRTDSREKPRVHPGPSIKVLSSVVQRRKEIERGELGFLDKYLEY